MSRNSETEIKIHFKKNLFFVYSKLNGQKLEFNTPFKNEVFFFLFMPRYLHRLS